MIPASGSAYTYSYVVFGELIAWMIGVALILEYTLVVSAVAVGWSGYAAGFLKSVGLGLPDALIQGPALGGSHQPAGHLHHLGRRGAADRRNARERDAQRHPGRDQDPGARLVRRRRAAGVQCLPLPPVHAVRLPAQRPVRERGRRHGRRGDHLLRFLWVRRDRHRRRGGQEPEPRPCDRDRRVDGGLRAHLHGASPRRRSARSPPRASPTAPSRWR